MESNSPTPISVDLETEGSLTISALLQLDPEQVTDDQLQTRVTFLRERRVQWEAEEGSSKRSGKKAKISKGASAKAVGDLKLEDLDLDL